MQNINIEWMGKKYHSEKELKVLLTGLVDEFRDVLYERYKSLIVDVHGKERVCFKNSHGVFFYPGYMLDDTDTGFHCLVIDYADTIEEIKKYWDEEGSQFFPEDYKSKDELFEAMLAEIEDAYRDDD